MLLDPNHDINHDRDQDTDPDHDHDCDRDHRSDGNRDHDCDRIHDPDHDVDFAIALILCVSFMFQFTVLFATTIVLVKK